MPWHPVTLLKGLSTRHTDWRAQNTPAWGSAGDAQFSAPLPILALCLQLSQREGTQEHSCCTNCLLQRGEREEPKASVTHTEGKGHRIKCSEPTSCANPTPFQRIISGKSFGFKFASIPRLCFSFGPKELDQSVRPELSFPLTGIWAGVLWTDDPVP